MQEKNKITYNLLAVLGVVLISSVLTWQVTTALTADDFEEKITQKITEDKVIKNINADIEEKTAKIEKLTKQLYVYQKNIKEKQEESLTLQSQLDLLDNRLSETHDNIEKIKIEIEVTQDEIEVAQKQISIAEGDLEEGQAQLALIIREIYVHDQKTPIELTFANSNFSEFFANLEYVDRLGGRLQQSILKLKQTKQNLRDHQEELKDKKATMAKQRSDLETAEQSLTEEEEHKTLLLEETQLSEEKFQILVNNVKKEQSQIEGEISTLEKKSQQKILNIREALQKELALGDTTKENLSDEEAFILTGEVGFIWPISARTITCGFRCEGYPFRRWFEHSAIDIATPMGTEVAAASSGYVAIAKFDGTSNYAYVMIVHGDGYSSVYGHLNNVYVEVDQYVRRGEIIGLSGGMPGTPGAGIYSTGAHLHFEIRIDGIPVDPLGYLPAS